VRKIAQLLQCDPYLRIVRYDPENYGKFISLTRPVCLALVETGREQTIVATELVDSEILEVDTSAKNFLGIVSITNKTELKALEDKAFELAKKDNNG
jgi:hypothetical protein